MSKKKKIIIIISRNEPNAPEFVEAESIEQTSSNEVEVTIGDNDDVTDVQVEDVP